MDRQHAGLPVMLTSIHREVSETPRACNVQHKGIMRLIYHPPVGSKISVRSCITLSHLNTVIPRHCPLCCGGVLLSSHGQSSHLGHTRGSSNLLPVGGNVYLRSQQEDAAQEPKQAVLRGALLELHCMAGGSAAERQAQDMVEAREEYSWCTYSVTVDRRSL